MLLSPGRHVNRPLSQCLQWKPSSWLHVKWYEDNQSCIQFSEHPSHDRRTKHIAYRFFFIRDLITNGDITMEYINTLLNTADMFTKPLPTAIFQQHVDNLVISLTDYLEAR
jgi:hypothetical protein